MKIYLATSGSCSDYHVVGAYSTKEKAAEALVLHNSDNPIEEYDLDAVIDHPPGMVPWEVWMNRDGNCELNYGVRQVSRTGPDDCMADSYIPYLTEGHRMFCMWARDEQHAVKIANERRAKMIALNQW